MGYVARARGYQTPSGRRDDEQDAGSSDEMRKNRPGRTKRRLTDAAREWCVGRRDG